MIAVLEIIGVNCFIFQTNRETSPIGKWICEFNAISNYLVMSLLFNSYYIVQTPVRIITFLGITVICDYTL